MRDKEIISSAETANKYLRSNSWPLAGVVKFGYGSGIASGFYDSQEKKIYLFGRGSGFDGYDGEDESITFLPKYKNILALDQADRSNLVNFSGPDSSIFTSFKLGENVYIGGDFIGFNSSGSINTNRSALFDYQGENVEVLVSSDVRAVSEDGSGGFYIGGSFTTINGVPRSRLAHINSSGYLTEWAPSASGQIEGLAAVGDNIYIVGRFASIDGQNVIEPRFAAVNTSGALLSWPPSPFLLQDTSLSNGPSSISYINGKLYIRTKSTGFGTSTSNISSYIKGDSFALSLAGQVEDIDLITTTNFGSSGNTFYLVDNNVVYAAGLGLTLAGTPNSVRGRGFATISSNTGQVVSEDNQTNFDVLSVCPDGSGGVYIGGNFTTVNGVTRNRVAHINSSGQLTSWNPSASSSVRAIVKSGDNIYIGGAFTALGGATRNRLAAVNTAGNLLTWNPSANSNVCSFSVIADTIYVGGFFTALGGATRNRLAAVNTAGNLLTWNPSANSYIHDVAAYGDNIYISGQMTAVAGQTRRYLAAVNTNGNLLSWNPSASSGAYRARLRGDNIYVCGFFTSIAGQTRRYLAAVNTNGNLLSWDPNAGGAVFSLDVKENVVYVGGQFFSFNNNTYSAQRLAAVNSDGSIDSSFCSAINTVWDIKVDGDNVHVGGSPGFYGFKSRKGGAALNLTTGELLSWDPNVSVGHINRAVKSGDNIYLAGAFSQVSGQNRTNLALVNTNGDLLPWNPNVAGLRAESIHKVGGDILVAGSFTSINGVATSEGLFSFDAISGDLAEQKMKVFSWMPSLLEVNGKLLLTSSRSIYPAKGLRRAFAALNSSGSLLNLDMNINGTVFCSFPLGDNIYIGGSFTSVGGQTRNRLAAFNTSGSLLPWDPNANSSVCSFSAVGDNIYIGGDFTSVSGTTRNRLAAVNTNGDLLSWDPNANATVRSIDSNENVVYVGGSFTSVADQARARYAEISTDGSLLGEDLNFNSTVSSIGVFGSNAYVRGTFTNIKATQSRFAAFSSSDGSLDSSKFYFNNVVFCMESDGFGGVYIGGNFTTVNGVTRNRVAHINSSGQLTSWNPSASSTVRAIVKSGDNIYIGGAFTGLGGATRNLLAAVDTAGNLLSWDAGITFGYVIYAITVLGDNIYFGGDLYEVAGTTRNGFAAVNTSGSLLSWNPNAYVSASVVCMSSAGSNIYIGGAFTTVAGQTRRYLAAVNTNGNLLSWNPSANSYPTSLVAIGDNIYIGGYFTSIAGTTRNYLAAVNTNGDLLSWNPSASSFVLHIDRDGSNIYATGQFDSVGEENTRSAIIDASTGQVFNWKPQLPSTGFGYSIRPSSDKVYIGGTYDPIGDDYVDFYRLGVISGNTYISFGDKLASSINTFVDNSWGIVFAGDSVILPLTSINPPFGAVIRAVDNKIINK